jgi:hypothetical protein
MKKIMFNDKFGLTQAVLDGRKTMTRRIVSEKLLDRWTDYDDFCNNVSVENAPTERQYYDEKDFFLNNAPYKLGEVVAIAQSYKDIGYNGEYSWVQDGIHYHRDRAAGWANKMFVKVNLMPHHIEITGIKVERLQDISDEDILREGIYRFNDFIFAFDDNKGYIHSFDSAKEAFISLINKVSGKGVFQSNPFVFAYEFRLTD